MNLFPFEQPSGFGLDIIISVGFYSPMVVLVYAEVAALMKVKDIKFILIHIGIIM